MAVIEEPRPEPVLDAGKVAGAITGIITAVLGALVLAGVINQENADAWLVVVTSIGTALATLAAVAFPIYQAHQARKKVTPLSDPVDEQGAPLVPAA